MLVPVSVEDEDVPSMQCSSEEVSSMSSSEEQASPASSCIILVMRRRRRFRRQATSTNPKVVDMQIYRAREELMNYSSQSKQRHHVISRWVVGPQGQVPSAARKAIQPGILPKGHESPFLLDFYQGN